jgi:hypothetical protein
MGTRRNPIPVWVAVVASPVRGAQGRPESEATEHAGTNAPSAPSAPVAAAPVAATAPASVGAAEPSARIRAAAPTIASLAIEFAISETSGIYNCTKNKLRHCALVPSSALTRARKATLGARPFSELLSGGSSRIGTRDGITSKSEQAFLCAIH